MPAPLVDGSSAAYTDVTRSDREREAAITEAVAEIADSRAVIEQAKGMLMYVFRIESDAAFDLLRWRSQHNNVKLRALAQQLLDDVCDLAPDDAALPSRAEFDQLLLTTHERVPTSTSGRGGATDTRGVQHAADQFTRGTRSFQTGV